MASSGRDGDDVKQPASDGMELPRPPLERSPEGRFVIRSSSHPPTEQTRGVDSSGVHSRPRGGAAAAAGPQDPSGAASEPEPGAAASQQGLTPREADRGRPGRSTPAERPRKRKELRQSATYLAGVRARCDTPRALPGMRISDRPGRAPWMAEGSSLAGDGALPAIAALNVASSPSATDREESQASVDEVTRLIVEKLLIEPPEQLKDLPDEETQIAYTEAINRVFRLREGEPSPVPDETAAEATPADPHES